MIEANALGRSCPGSEMLEARRERRRSPFIRVARSEKAVL
jgi:hypothetical protein